MSEASKPEASEGGARVLAWLAALNPLLLLLVGYWLNHGIDKARLGIERQKAEIEALKAAADTSSVYTKTQVDKVKVIGDFLNDLTGKDETRRSVAMEAINIVLPPNEARRILNAVQQSGGDGNANAKAAKSLLERDRQRLLSDMFADDKARRSSALHTLSQGWADDEATIAALIDRVMLDVQARDQGGWAEPATPIAQQQRASIYNTAKFLSLASIVDPGLREKALKFAEQAARNSADSAALAEVIKQRYR
ncbi:hypothetical protein RQP53_23540 [Paucibacter sp. APW11]|uniref:Uncharacterized protein n=1 Tax=Roseateles aquae TaxID=3077235 RepID=A0ABU3PI71_9BURK|nr:hypothetical protein [Paucibacter sp. APW11]MDT9002274.1 hypothetical protein [Paucibacter sp. APW11]